MTPRDHIELLKSKLPGQLLLVGPRSGAALLYGGAFFTTDVGFAERVAAGASVNRRCRVWAVITGWDVQTEYTCYWSTLHELGHVACGHHRNNLAFYEANTVRAEVDAWAWAIRRAIVPVTRRMAHSVRTYWLGSYLDAYHTNEDERGRNWPLVRDTFGFA